MKMFKTYVKAGKAVDYGRMQETLGVRLFSIDSDGMGAYAKLIGPDDVGAGEISHYNGVREVIEYDAALEGRSTLTKAYLKKRNMIDYESLVRDLSVSINGISSDENGSFVEMEVPAGTPAKLLKRYIRGLRRLETAESASPG